MGRAKPSGEDRTKTGSDFLQLDIEAAPAGGRATWLAEQLRLAMADGRLPVGTRLPATRTLATDLNVSRGVVTEAYQRLVEDGHVAGRGRAGTVIVAVPAKAPRTRAPKPPKPADVFADRPGDDIFERFRAAPARIDLSPGVPDLASFPRQAWLRAERKVLAMAEPAAFGYGDPHGTPALRQAVAAWLARNRGIRVEPSDVLITAGVSQALGLLAKVLLANGITEVAVEDPGSLGVRQHLRNGGLRTPPIPVDAAGLRVDVLEASGAKAVMTTPAHQFPTGVVLDPARRRRLLGWPGLIIEDDYDAEHRYGRAPVPALRAALPEQVCYAGSVSKLLAPALRIGWLLVPARLRAEITAAKRDADLGNAALPQLVLADLMTTGALERHLRQLRRRHLRRRDAMIAAIHRHLPGAVVHGAAAGLHLTVTFPEPLADTDLAAAAFADGVKAQPLSWHRQLPGAPGLVLGYAATPVSDIEEGITILGRAFRTVRGGAG